ncbi:MAG: MBL fold metallo-hydrolase [Clostridia bacterium]|nr:MBL fold metallo-hydrolase [Clostridia bacterium]
MSKIYQRKIFALFSVIFVCLFILCSCVPSSVTEETVNPEKSDEIVLQAKFSVHFIDVGNGDCILIKFPDSKRMLIDCGDKIDGVYSKINDYLKSQNVDKIDFLVLTHPDRDHIGNAVDIINDFEIGTAYIPHILSNTLFPLFNSVKQELTAKNIDFQVSHLYSYIKGEGYSVAFLSPAPPGNKKSAYNILNSALSPTANDINNVSPIIYVEYNGVRFLFTGDAGKSQEEYVLDLYKSSLYKRNFEYYGFDVNLENIDFLKVSHHGSDDATSENFLQTLNPKNAVISVGGNNYYGLPSSNTLIRLNALSEEFELYRTDTKGSVAVYVNEMGNYRVITEL